MTTPPHASQRSDAIPADSASLQTPKSKRHAGNSPYRLLDAWRGFAALWVVMVHSCDKDISARFSDLANVPLYRFSLWGGLGVTMFFVISGYCIANAAVRAWVNPQPLKHFLKARLRRIYPAYFFASVLTILLATLLAVLVKYHVLQSSETAKNDFFHHGLRYYFATLTITQVPFHVKPILVVLWSLCYEVAFYGVVAILLVLAKRFLTVDRLLDALGVTTILSLTWLNYSGQSCPFPWNLWPQFGLGVLAYQLLAQPDRRLTYIFMSASLGLMALFAMRYSYGQSLDHTSSRVQSVFCIFFTLALLGLFRWDDALTRLRPVRWMIWVGGFSYSLYLVHTLLLGLLSQIGKKLHLSEPHFFYFYVLEIVASMCVGLAFFTLFEKPFLSRQQIRLQFAFPRPTDKEK
jgi:exopolysaccharide production protein ExoZ